MRPFSRRRGAVLVAAVVLAGCGGGDPSPPPPQSGKFVGTDAGVGVSIDFTGFDETTRRIQDALGDDRVGWTIGIVSVVNRTSALVPVPTLSGTDTAGRPVRLERADRDPVAAAARVPDAGRYVPVEGALTVYVLSPTRAERIGSVSMRLGASRPVALRALPRD